MKQENTLIYVIALVAFYFLMMSAVVVTYYPQVLTVEKEAEMVTVPQRPALGFMAPDFELEDLNGEAVSLSSFQGRPVILNFWASWCVPCREEMPYFEDAYRDSRWASEGLVVLAVNIRESPATVQRFIDSQGLTFPVLLDSEATVALLYNISPIPSTFIIDKDGIIKYVLIGRFISREAVDRILEDKL